MADCIPNTPFAFNGGASNNNRMGGGGSPNEADVNDENRKLFLGGLSWETDEQDLVEYFGKFGEVDKVTIKYDNITRRSRGFGFVTFINPDTVETVLSGGPHFIKNRAVDPKRPKGKTGLKKIFVGGINGDLTKEEIKGYFEKFGAIEHIERPFDRQRNRSRDFCFVIFETDEAAESAISSPKQVIGGKECDIKIAHPQRNNMHANGNGNGFGGPGGPGLGGRGGGQGGRPGGQPGFFKGRNPNVAGGGGGNWRSNERGPGGNFRGSGSHDERFADTQFLTNIDTIPNNGYSGYKTYTNSNFFPNYWN